jgi:hypothetical protein
MRIKSFLIHEKYFIIMSFHIMNMYIFLYILIFIIMSFHN